PASSISSAPGFVSCRPGYLERPWLETEGSPHEPPSLPLAGTYTSAWGLAFGFYLRVSRRPALEHRFLERSPRSEMQIAPRQQPERVKPEIVKERGFKTIHLLEEMIAEFDYRPSACQRTYRVIVDRKRLGIDLGQMRLFEEYRYFFYITNDREMTAAEVVFSAN